MEKKSGEQRKFQANFRDNLVPTFYYPKKGSLTENVYVDKLFSG